MDPKTVSQDTYIQQRQLELLAKMEEYNKLGIEINEYQRIIKFCKRFLIDDTTTTPKKKRILASVSPDIFTRAEVTSDSKIAIRLMDDLFAEMSIPKAIIFAEKRCTLLKVLAKRTRNECHFLQAQLNILLLGLDVLANKDIL